MIQALLVLLLLLHSTRAERLVWSERLDEGHVAQLLVLDDQGQRIARLLTADGSDRSALGWCPDRDPLPGRVRIELDHVWLAPGRYRIEVLLPDRRLELSFEPSEEPPRKVLLETRPEGRGVIAWHDDGQGGHDGLAWAPLGAGGITWMPLGPGEWLASQPGSDASSFTIQGDAIHAAFAERGPPTERTIPRRTHALFRWALLPITLLILGLGGVLVWRVRRTRGLPVALGFAVAAALVAVAPALSGPGDVLLSEGERFTDPADSVAQIAAVAESLPALSDWTHCYAFPEGSAWTITGPNWLGYLLPAAISWVAGPVAGHNLALAAYLALLFLCAWGLARSLGAEPWPALIAGGCAVLAPIVMEELDVLSIDRATLFTVPLFLLCLHRAHLRESWPWALGAGVALAAAFYGQVHYGLYLLAALPLLALPRLFQGSLAGNALKLLATVALALALMAPGLAMLLDSAEETPYGEDDRSLIASGQSLLAPFDELEIEAFLDRYDVRVGADHNPPMGTPKERLFTAISRSKHIGDIVQPDSSLPGRDLYWVLVLAAVWLSRKRRGAALASWDVLVLCVLALGPFLRFGDRVLPLPLPYYLDFLLIPGFEQLKQVARYLLMAACICGVPIALGAQGLGERITERLGDRLAGLPRAIAGAGGALLLLAALILVAEAEPEMPAYRPIDEPLEEGWRPPRLTLFFAQPSTIDAAAPAALERLEPGGTLVLPLDPPLPRQASLAAASLGLELVNDAPYGSPKRPLFPFWYEESPFLSAAALEAGSARAKRPVSGADLAADLAALHQAGLRNVVLYREHLAGPELVGPAEAFLDRWLERVVDEAEISAWALPAPASAPEPGLRGGRSPGGDAK